MRLLPSLGLVAVLLVSGVYPATVMADEQSASLLSTSRSQVTIDRDMVRLGDLFLNTGDKASRIIDAAPPAGSPATYDVHRLASIARANALTWQAQSWSEKVIVERASQTIPSEQVLRQLQQAIDKKMPAGSRYEIDVAGRNLSLVLPRGKTSDVAVSALRINQANSQFSAMISAPANDPAAVKTSVTGRFFRVLEVPVLNKRIANGDIIERNDIHWLTLRASAVSRNVITDVEQLLGMTPARTALAGKPLMNGAVRAPRLVTKGSLVTMVLKTPHMVLTSKGKALGHAAKGETVKVMNTQSKTVIEGEVTATGMVWVTATAFMPLGVAELATTAARN